MVVESRIDFKSNEDVGNLKRESDIRAYEVVRVGVAELLQYKDFLVDSQ